MIAEPILFVAAHASGVIDVSARLPVHALLIAELRGADAIFHGVRLVATHADLGRDNITHRVPGMLHGETFKDRLRALDRFAARIKQDLAVALRQQRKAA